MQGLFLKQANSGRPAMGLEAVGLSVFEGATSTFSPVIVQGKVIHGIESKADIELVEKWYGYKFENPDHVDFWAQLMLTVEHGIMPLSYKNPEDILRISVLKAQGKLAPSIEEQGDPNAHYTFVLVDEGAEETVKASIYEKRALAQSKLTEIKEKSPRYMLSLAKYLINHQTHNQSATAAYAKLYEFIEGKLNAKKNEAVDTFLQTLDPSMGGSMPKEELLLRVDIQTAIARQIIRRNNANQVYYNVAVPDSNYGRTAEEVFGFLTQMQNADHMGTGNSTDTPYSIRYQLKQSEA